MNMPHIWRSHHGVVIDLRRQIIQTLKPLHTFSYLYTIDYSFFPLNLPLFVPCGKLCAELFRIAVRSWSAKSRSSPGHPFSLGIIYWGGFPPSLDTLNHQYQCHYMTYIHRSLHLTKNASVTPYHNMVMIQFCFNTEQISRNYECIWHLFSIESAFAQCTRYYCG